MYSVLRYRLEGGRSLQEGKPGWWSARGLVARGMERRVRVGYNQEGGGRERQWRPVMGTQAFRTKGVMIELAVETGQPEGVCSPSDNVGKGPWRCHQHRAMGHRL